MRKSLITEEQMVAILRESDRDGVAAVARKHAVSEQTICSWRNLFGALRADEVRRLKSLETEIARLKKLVAERDLEIEVMKETPPKKMVSMPARRGCVAYAICLGLSQRRICTLLRTSRNLLK